VTRAFRRASAKEKDAVIGEVALSILRLIKLRALTPEAMLLAMATVFKRASPAVTAEEAAADAARLARSLAEAEAVAVEEIVACNVTKTAAKATPFAVPAGSVAGSLYLAPNPELHG